MSKTLSSGTLSLRFMQNAPRSKGSSEANLDPATLLDDAEWRVPQNVWDAWTSDGATVTNSKP